MEELIAQVMFLHQVTELADGGLVWHGLPVEINADEPPQRTGVVEGILGSRIRQVEPLLNEEDAQHALNAYWAPAGAPRFGVERFDDFRELLSGNNGFQLFEGLLLMVFLPVLFEFSIRERALAHPVMLLV